MAKVSIFRMILQFVAVLMISSYFLWQAYEIFMNKEKWASSLYSAYGNFAEWWNKSFKRVVIKEFAYEIPVQREMYPYKHKAAMIFGYLYGFGALLLLTGEALAGVLLIFPHAIYSVMTNAPSAATTFTGFNNMQQNYLLDLALIFVLLMASGSTLNIATGGSKKQAAVKTENK